MGIYNADGTLLGELAYVLRKYTGRGHCELCDITHGMFTKKSQWQVCEARLPVPFATFHRNDQPADVRACIGTHLPAVVARTDGGVIMFATPDELESCNGNPETLLALLASKLDASTH